MKNVSDTFCQTHCLTQEIALEKSDIFTSFAVMY